MISLRSSLSTLVLVIFNHETKLNQGKNLQEKFNLLQKGLAVSPSAQEALSGYFENQLPKLLQDLLTAFLAKASWPQKQKLLKLMKEA